MNVCSSCPYDTIKYGKKCYYASPVINTKDEAQYECNKYGASLIEIDSYDEFMFMQNLVYWKVYRELCLYVWPIWV